MSLRLYLTITIILVALYYGYQFFLQHQPPNSPPPPISTSQLKSYCLESNLDWSDQYQECSTNGDRIDPSQCQQLGGNFVGCDSPCRHNPLAKTCIQSCVQTCTIK